MKIIIMKGIYLLKKCTVMNDLNLKVIDNFLLDPHESRQAFKACLFNDHETSTPWSWEEVPSPIERDYDYYENRFTKILKQPVQLIDRKYRTYGASIVNPYNVTHVHYDDAYMTAFVYLNLNTQFDPSIDGTDFVMHKGSQENFFSEKCKFLEGSYVKSGISPIGKVGDFETMIQNEKFNPEAWEVQVHVPMKFNRLVMFNSKYFHTISRAFGTCVDSARCVEIFHMNRRN